MSATAFTTPPSSSSAGPTPALAVDFGPDGGSFTGLVVTSPIAPGDQGAYAKVYEIAGHDPADFRIKDETVHFKVWNQSSRTKDGDRDIITLYAYGADFIRITEADRETEDLAPLLAIARANARKRPSVKPKDLTRVVVCSDGQIAKVGSRGGTPALLGRVEDLLVQLDQIMVAQPCRDALVADPGDLTEGFENVAAQQFTNDLSHPAQLRVARAMLTNIVTTVAARHHATVVATVPSNHAAWRRGKNVLGRPCDDYGIDAHMAVHEALSRDPHFRHVTWEFPSDWNESLAIKVRGAVVGMVHGHQVGKPDSIPGWWKGQAHGSQAVKDATILITGHYHHFRAQPSGAVNGVSRTWFQAPTMDNGSDWYRNASGEDSEPGILTFTIDDAGRWDNLRLITPSPAIEVAA